jgi:hypothetical protein
MWSLWYVMVVIIWQLDIQLPVQSVHMPITTNVVSLNPVHGEVYSIQHYVIKFVSDLRHVGGFLRKLQFPPRYNWNIVESGIKHHKPNHMWSVMGFPRSHMPWRIGEGEQVRVLITYMIQSIENITIWTSESLYHHCL